RFFFSIGGGLNFAPGIPVSEVQVGPEYDGNAYRGGNLAPASAFIIRGHVLFGPRFPLGGSMAFISGAGLGFDYWMVHATDGAKTDDSKGGALADSEKISEGMLKLPLYGALEFKPTCGFAMLLGAWYSVGLTGLKASYPSLSLGFAIEDCGGVHGSSSSSSPSESVPTYAPAAADGSTATTN